MSTLVISPARGTGRLGSQLDQCYDGETHNGQRHGYGCYRYPNTLFRYDGQYINGKKHGFGRLSIGADSWYEGQFQEDEIQGEGTRTYSNGAVYSGSFEQGEMHGFGSLQMPSGDSYEGHFACNLFSGNGVYKFANGDMYQGDFVRHKFHGQGVFQSADGTRYQGDWVAGQRNGKGECVFSNGNIYRGDWVDDQMEGEGELQVKRLGVAHRGAFLAGEPIAAAEKLNALFMVEVPAEGGKKDAKKGKPALDLEALARIEVMAGQPLPHPIVISAQQAVPQPITRTASSTVSTDGSGAEAPTATEVPIYQEHPAPGNVWKDVDMEHGRLVSMTLHSQVQPKAVHKQVSVRLCTVCDASSKARGSSDGNPPEVVRVRVLLSEELEASPCLPLSLTSTGEPITALEFRLQAGKHTLPQLVPGCMLPSGQATCASGSSYTFLFTSPEILPGKLQMHVVEQKAAAKKK